VTDNFRRDGESGRRHAQVKLEAAAKTGKHGGRTGANGYSQVSWSCAAKNRTPGERKEGGE